MGVAPSGKNIEVEGISILRLQNGKIQHQTTIWDALGLMQQIGAVPPLGEPAVT
jgi:predicted ester cyclase